MGMMIDPAILGGAMGKYDREYEAFQIFEQIQGDSEEGERPAKGSGIPQRRSEPLPWSKQAQPKQEQAASEETSYYEIEYDSCPMLGVGKFVLKSEKLQPDKIPEQPKPDPAREMFNRMREIAREDRALYFGHSKFYDKRVQQENARLFYRQGMFMKDFEDDCEKSLPYSAYFPNYQMMGYGQLRTYFTWRTQVRQGDVRQTSLSYAFLYIYELLNNIGVQDPRDGLERLVFFWDIYRDYDDALDKYVPRWLKDYHIYYELPWSFREFVEENGLSEYYPKLIDPEDTFDLYCAISKYDIRKSLFYTEANSALVRDCFSFTMDRLRQVFAENRADLEEYIFQPTRSMVQWTPFQGALFYQTARQADRRVVLSEKEIYVCAGNRWTFNATITTQSGRQLLGFCLKQMESVLRRLTSYKHKLSANIGSLSPVMAAELQKRGISLEAVITGAVEVFYREATKTVVKVDRAALEKIRREALATQERLIVPEDSIVLSADPYGQGQEGGQPLSGGWEDRKECPKEEIPSGGDVVLSDSAMGSTTEAVIEAKAIEVKALEVETMEAVELAVKTGVITETKTEFKAELTEAASDPWESLSAALSEGERKALALALEDGREVKSFADSRGIMLEVLMDGINEKAMDFVGDSLLDDECMVYDDYREQVKGMVESL